MTQPADSRTFGFAFDPSYRRLSWLFGVTEARALVTLSDGRLDARFGPWRVTTALANIGSVEVTGPFRFVKTAGPARLAISDRGLTFATNGDRGACLTFRAPVPGIEPTGRLRHPNLTLTVADVDAFVAAVRASIDPG